MLERLSFGTFVIRFNSFCVWGLPFMTSLNRKFTQPPFLRLLTMSAFEGTPPQCGRHKWKPPMC